MRGEDRVTYFRLTCFLWLATAACTTDNPLFCDATTPCDEGLVCDQLTFECTTPSPDDRECDQSMECTAVGSPICVPELFKCRPCTAGGGNQACAARDETAPLCADNGACVVCIESLDCPATAPICGDGDCAICELGDTGNADCAARDATLPVCSGEGRCVECIADNDCASTLCDTSTNTCVATGNVIFVAEDGADSGGCGMPGGPCATLGGEDGALDKLIGERRFIRMAPGTYEENPTIVGETVRIFAEGADLASDDSGGAPALIIRDSDVFIRGLTIRFGRGEGPAHGILCERAASDTTLRLDGVTIRNNDGRGIEAEECAVDLRGVTIDNNERGGIAVEGARLDLVDSTVSNNDDTGIEVQDADATIIGNYVIRNGVDGVTPVGGIDIEAASNSAIIEFNTIAANQASESGDIVRCFFSPETSRAANNIVFGNSGGEPVLNCNFTFSLIEGAETSNGNIADPPMFVDAANNDFHLQSGSPGIDAGDPDSVPRPDQDGDPRPLGAGFDMGADEVE